MIPLIKEECIKNLLIKKQKIKGKKIKKQKVGLVKQIERLYKNIYSKHQIINVHTVKRA